MHSGNMGMLFQKITDLPSLKIGAGRQGWVDIAKAISISLLVAWHWCRTTYLPNELLIFVRMPLFLLVAGFFMRKALVGGWKPFLKSKTGHFLYLFVLWSWIIYFTANVPMRVYNNLDLDYLYLLRIFYNPPSTIWFLYALLIISLLTKLVKNVPFWILLLVSIILYSWNTLSGEWFDLSIFDRIIRLIPFFFIGVFGLEKITLFVCRWKNYWLLFFIAYWPLAYLTYFGLLARIGPVTFMVSIIGLVWVLLLSKWIDDSRFSKVIAYVGASSLYIFVMHRIPMTYFESTRWIFPKLYEQGMLALVIDMFIVFIIIITCAFSGRYLHNKGYTRFLFQIPWPKETRGNNRTSPTS